MTFTAKSTEQHKSVRWNQATRIATAAAISIGLSSCAVLALGNDRQAYAKEVQARDLSAALNILADSIWRNWFLLFLLVYAAAILTTLALFFMTKDRNHGNQDHN